MMTTASEKLQTVDINGKAFAVTVNEDKTIFGRYTLTKVGGRGLTYTTQRNANRSHMMVLINENVSGPKAVTNIWISDANGSLQQVEW